jgi:acyl-CoA thioesterase I
MMLRLTRPSALFLTWLVWSPPANAAKIACVGDSITYGSGLGDPGTQAYPAVLGATLGSAHEVQNFGVSGATLLKNGDLPYWDQGRFTASTNFEPDVVVVMLGTNDSKSQNWSREAEFSPDYLELIAHYRALGALVYVATPPPVFPPGAFGIPPDVVEDEVVPLVRAIAEEANAPLVEVFNGLSGQSANFPDTVHPNAAGAALIAEVVAAALEDHGFGGAGMMAGAGGSAQGGQAGRGGASAGGSPMGGAAGQAASGGAGGVPASAGVTFQAGAGGDDDGLSGTGGAAQGGRVGEGGALSGSTGGSLAGMTSVSGGTSAAQGGAGGTSSLAGSGGTADAAGSAAEVSSAPDAGGCGCRASGSDQRATRASWTLLALAVALGLRRRRATAR